MTKPKGAKECVGDRVVTCPTCQAERSVTYAQEWCIRTGKSSGECKACSLRRKRYPGRKNPSEVRIHTELGRSLYRTKFYAVWSNMRNRCQNPNNVSWPNYGGREITVCERWASFDAFAADMHAGYVEGVSTIERIDNDGPYSPENCRWATKAEQARNTRRSRNRTVTLHGVTQLVSQWAEQTGLKRNTIEARLNRGWSEEEALTIPPLRRG